MRWTWMVLLVCLAFNGCAEFPAGDAGSKDAEGAYDIVIYGGTSAAIAAAVQAKKMGRSVIVVSPDKHLGGLSAGGLGWTDSGNKAVIGGVSRDFYHRVWQQYNKPGAWKWQKQSEYGNKGQGTAAIDGEERTMWIFEPHVAERVFEDWVKEYDIEVVRDAWLDREKGVKVRDRRIESITTLDGKTYRGRMFVDATYEGDLMAAAGVSYTVGREGNSKYGETINGVQIANAKKHQFENKISPYVIPDDPSSGLLPRVHDGDPGKQGEGDHRVQAYNFRICMTQVPENRVAWPKPEGYDAKQYELLLRDLQAGSRHIFGKIDPIPNRKTDTNNHGSFSTDNIGMNYDYPEASYERRREIIKEHEVYQKGYFYFLANDPRVPQDVREKMSQWGLAKDEFLDNGHWPHQIYVREARRMVGDSVVSEMHLRKMKPTTDSIGMGSYNMDSHNVQRYVAKDENGRAYVLNEGDVQIGTGGPYPISYGAIVPKRSEVRNLLVPVAVSSSHIAYGSIRMEPVFMILGQSATTAASLALDGNMAVQDVPYETLKARLIADGQVLEWDGTVAGGAMDIDSKKLPGVVVDDAKAKFTGEWLGSSSAHPYVDVGYRHDNAEGQGKKEARYEAKLPKAGQYEVRISYTAHENRASNTPVTIHHAEGSSSVKVNQKRKPALDGAWVSLGFFQFSGDAAVVISNAGADGHVIADAVQFLPK